MDEIVLTMPRDRRFFDVAQLVVGGLASRLNLTVDNLADLQLALAGLLPRGDADGDVTVVLRLDEEGGSAWVEFTMAITRGKQPVSPVSPLP